MQKINFQNLPNTTTPINATNLNAIQTNAETAINDVADDLSDYVDGTTAMGNITTGDLTVGGTLYTSNTGREDYAAFGFYYDGAGNMTHKRNNAYDNFTINDSSGNSKIKIYPESGDVQIKSSGISSNVMFMHSGSMPSTDLNNIKCYGSYNFDNGSNSYSNAPETSGIQLLDVGGEGEWLVQRVYVLRWGASSVPVYIRIYTPGGWSNWQRII
jgi:hypothetical protein